MLKRMIVMLGLTLAVIAGLAFVKYKQIQSAIAQAAYTPPPEAVTTAKAQQVTWPSTLNAIGTVAAVQGVVVSADLPGTVDKIAFESGKWVREGDVLVQLDTRQERAQLAAVEAQRDLAAVNFGRMQNLAKDGIISRSDFDTAAANQKETEARVGEIRATIERKTIRAPFSGVLGLRQVNLGQYLSAGDPVVPLQSLNPIYVNFGVPQQDAAQVRMGREVRIAARELAGIEFGGRVTALDSVVDPSTRNIQVQATLSNPENKLRPGMFVQAELGLGQSQTVITIPTSGISYAPYGDSVFVVTTLKDEKGKSYLGVRQQFVKVGGARGDQVGVLSGLKPGDEVVTSGVFKLRNGVPVQVNNKVVPENNPAPNPEDS
jgi:membrane fusion protein (multidrug efflux system)